ncbi:MAG: transposase [Polyangiaceae bacterium]|nr:transposase [Polyangiaceae bacterium]
MNRRHARRKKRQEHPRKRRGPGKKSKNAKMAAVGVLYTLRRAADGRLEGPANKRTYATFVSYRALFEWIHAEARRRGYGTKKFKKVLFIADGAEVLWSLQQEFFPDADVCLDWFHVVEKLWKAGKAICRGTRRERQHLEAWVAEQKRSLRHGKHAEVAAVIEAALEATPSPAPATSTGEKCSPRSRRTSRKNAARLEYSRLRRQDLDILQRNHRGGGTSPRRCPARRPRHAVESRSRRGRPPAPLRPHQWPLG